MKKRILKIVILIIIFFCFFSVKKIYFNNDVLPLEYAENKNKYSENEIRAKVEELLQNYNSDENFEIYMERSLQIGVQQNNERYNFVFGTYEIQVDTNKILNINKINIDIDNIYESVYEMKKDISIKSDELLETKGYYSKELGGGAYYRVVNTSNINVDEAKCVKLDNGLYAELYVLDNTISVNQFGAYGNGINDDTLAIQKALDSGYGNLLFESKEYKVTETLNIFNGNLNIFGNNTTLFTDNDFHFSKEWFLRVRANNIKLYFLNIEARETIDVGYKTQIGIMRSENVLIDSCNFIIPETTERISKLNPNKEYTNIDLYSAWKDIVITNCNLKLLHNGGAGGCIWIRDLGELGCNGLEFSNNDCYKISHDEILAIFRGYIQNVKIVNNRFKIEEKDGNESVMNFSIGSSNSLLCDNILIEKNEIDGVSKSGLLWATKASNININDNVIKYKKSTNSTMTNYVFRNRLSNINLRNNEMYILNNNSNKAITVFDGNDFYIEDNIIKVNTDIAYLFSGCTTINNNNILMNGNCDNVVNNLLKECIGNVIELNGKVDHVFQWHNVSISNNINIQENYIYYNYDELRNGDSSIFTIVNGTYCNNKLISFKKNNFIGNKINPAGYLLYFVVNDKEIQNIIFYENNIDTYIKKYISDLQNFVENDQVIVVYSETNLTNNDVIAKLIVSGDGQINGNNEHVFNENGTFTFRYILNGEEKEFIAVVDWIDKDAPVISGLDNRTDETQVATISVSDKNLDSVVVTRDGQVIPFNNGDTLFEVGNYVITASDKAGNVTVAELRIIDFVESNSIYYISLSGTGNGDSVNSPMSVATASGLKYNAGDKILFKSGEKYNINLNWNMMGSPDNVITISSYGEGSKPVINGSIELVSNLAIYGLEFNNSNESCLVTNQQYSENVYISNCIFNNIEDTAIYLNRQVSNVKIDNCVFKNCGSSGIVIKNDSRDLIAKDVSVNENIFINMNNAMSIAGKNENQQFENVQVHDNYFVNQVGDDAIISFGNVLDTKFDVKFFNNMYYNFKMLYVVSEENAESLKSNLVSDSNMFYALENSKLLNECDDFGQLQKEYKLEEKSKFVVMNRAGYQVGLVEEICRKEIDKSIILSYLFETVRLSSSDKKIQEIDSESGLVVASSKYDNLINSKIGSADELSGKNSQEKLEDTTVASEELPLAGLEKIAIGLVLILIINIALSGTNYCKYKMHIRKQIGK